MARAHAEILVRIHALYRYENIEVHAYRPDCYTPGSGPERTPGTETRRILRPMLSVSGESEVFHRVTRSRHTTNPSGATRDA